MSHDGPPPEIQSGGNRRTPYWPHAPEHRLGEGGTFIVTAGAYRKERNYSARKIDRAREETPVLWRLWAWVSFVLPQRPTREQLIALAKSDPE